MTEWVEKTEQTVRQSEPIDLNEPSHLIQAKYDKFKVQIYFKLKTNK